MGALQVHRICWAFAAQGSFPDFLGQAHTTETSHEAKLSILSCNYHRGHCATCKCRHYTSSSSRGQAIQRNDLLDFGGIPDRLLYFGLRCFRLRYLVVHYRLLGQLHEPLHRTPGLRVLGWHQLLCSRVGCVGCLLRFALRHIVVHYRQLVHRNPREHHPRSVQYLLYGRV